jgi:hypothetical protein
VAGTGTLLKRTGRSQRQYYDKERKRLLDQLLSPYSSAPMSFGLNASKVDFSHIIETRLFPQISPAPDLFRGSRTHALESNFRRLFLVPGQKLVVQRTQESRPPLPRPAFLRDILPNLDASLLGNANSLALCLVGSSQQESWKAIRGGYMLGLLFNGAFCCVQVPCGERHGGRSVPGETNRRALG